MDWSSFFLGAGVMFVATASVLNFLLYRVNKIINQIIEDTDGWK